MHKYSFQGDLHRVVYRPKTDKIILMWNRGRFSAYHIDYGGDLPIPINAKLWTDKRSQ